MCVYRREGCVLCQSVSEGARYGTFQTGQLNHKTWPTARRAHLARHRPATYLSDGCGAVFQTPPPSREPSRNVAASAAPAGVKRRATPQRPGDLRRQSTRDSPRESSRAGSSKSLPTNVLSEIKVDDGLRSNAPQARREADEGTLDDIFADAFSSDYLLRYAEKEFSSENVSFLLAMRKAFEAEKAGGGSSAPDAITLAQQMCKDHVEAGSPLEVSLPQKLMQDLMSWYERSVSNSKVRAAHAVLPPCLRLPS